MPRNKPTIFLEHLVKTARNIEVQYPFVDPAMLTYFLQTVQQLPAVFQKEVKQGQKVDFVKQGARGAQMESK